MFFLPFLRRRSAAAAPPVQTAPVRAQEGGVPREILRQVRLIELRTRGLVSSIFGGEYNSVFRGQGMEFAEVREYQAGDDVRNIDWNVTARVGAPYVKKHVEERELTVLLLVDLSGSEQFGTRERLKAELAAEIAAVFALSAVRNNDRVGLIIFTDRIEHVVPPRKGRRHVLRLIRDVLAFRPHGRGTDIGAALDYAARLLPHRGIVFVLSDFVPPARAETPTPWERSLKLVAQRHDIVAIRMVDDVERVLPDLGMLMLEDPETNELVAVDSARPDLRAAFSQTIADEHTAVQRVFRRIGVDEVEIRTGVSYVTPLLAFFRRRERARGRR